LLRTPELLRAILLLSRLLRQPVFESYRCKLSEMRSIHGNRVHFHYRSVIHCNYRHVHWNILRPFGANSLLDNSTIVESGKRDYCRTGFRYTSSSRIPPGASGRYEAWNSLRSVSHSRVSEMPHALLNSPKCRRDGTEF